MSAASVTPRFAEMLDVDPIVGSTLASARLARVAAPVVIGARLWRELRELSVVVRTSGDPRTVIPAICDDIRAVDPMTEVNTAIGVTVE